MSDSASNHTQRSAGPGRTLTGSRPAALRVLLVSLLVALVAVGCRGGQSNFVGEDPGQNTVVTGEKEGRNLAKETSLDDKSPGDEANLVGEGSGQKPNGGDEGPGEDAKIGDEGSGKDANVGVMFPQHDVPPTDYWSESFIARLVLEDGCLRAASRLLIWPNTFEFDTRDGVVRVVDATGRIAAHVGDDVRFGRASVSFEEARDRGWINGLSEDCHGPYWLVGEEVAAISPAGPSETPDLEAPEVHFPQHDAPLGTDIGGHYYAGRLVLREGCLRVEVPPDDNGPGVSRLLIWPNGYTSNTEDVTIRIVDERGRIAAHVGDNIRLSRATVSFNEAQDRGLIRGMSEECSGPYLLVGDEVSAFDLGNEPTELRLSDPDVLFPRQRTTIVTIRELLTAGGVGQLVLDDNCLRLGGDGDGVTIIWPAGFTPHVHGGVVHVRNGSGRIIAQVGDRIAGGGGYSSSGYRDCPGGTFGINSVKVLPDVEVYFPRQDGTLGTDQDMERFEGKLVLNRRCLEVDDAVRVRDRVIVPGGQHLLIWPDTFTLSLDDEVAEIVDESGRVVARVGDEVQFSAVSISYQEAMDHTGKRELGPACSGGYWVVGDDFAAVPDSESP